MLIQVQAIQVPKFWEVIKFACVKSANIQEENKEVYLINLLQDLLSGKKNCYVAQDEDNILFVFVISFMLDETKSIKYLYINNLYSFSSQPDYNWHIALTDIHKIGLAADCIEGRWDTNNKKVMQIGEAFGSVCLGKLYKHIL